MISQDLFDETVLENQEVFELDSDEAIQETISQFEKSKSSLGHLTLTHPESEQGIQARKVRRGFVDALTRLDNCIQKDGSLASNSEERTMVKDLVVIREGCVVHELYGLLDRHQGIYTLLTLLDASHSVNVLQSTLKVLTLVLQKTPSAKDLAGAVLQKPLPQLHTDEPDLQCGVLEFLQAACRNREANKQRWIQPRKGLSRLVAILGQSDRIDVAQQVAKFVTVLCRFDDFASPSSSSSSSGPTISSANETALELNRAGIVQALQNWTERLWTTDNVGVAEVLAAVLSALRVLAIHDDIIQSMVAIGVLDTARTALEVSTKEEQEKNGGIHEVALLTSTVGLLRNLSANDEIKTSLCLGSSTMPSVLPELIAAARVHLRQALLQEHYCGTLAAMALRRPNNALRILEADGLLVALTAMKQHPTNVVLQRQGCLAIRNVVSRLESHKKEEVLELGAEQVLRQSGRHQSCVDEAYAALRDLGCKVTRTTIHEDGTITTQPQMFGQVKSNFRAVYDD